MNTYIILGEVGRSDQRKVEKGIEKFMRGDLSEKIGFTVLLQSRYEIPHAVVWQCKVYL